MTFAEVTSLLALAVSAIGWYVSYFFNRRNTVAAATRARRQARMDAAETLTFDIANKVATHLMLPGSEPGKNGRLVVLQADLRRLNLILIEVFKVEGQAPARVPKAIGTCRTELWEFATGLLAADNAREAFDHDHPAITGALIAAQNIVSIARGKIAKMN